MKNRVFVFRYKTGIMEKKGEIFFTKKRIEEITPLYKFIVVDTKGVCYCALNHHNKERGDKIIFNYLRDLKDLEKEWEFIEVLTLDDPEVQDLVDKIKEEDTRRELRKYF